MLKLVSRPARNTDMFATLIDNIFKNNNDLNRSRNGILVEKVSDHFLIFYIN